MKKSLFIVSILLTLFASKSNAIMERGGYPWDVELRSFFDRKGPNCDGAKIPWLLNLGPTGIRARIYPDKPDLLVVKYVFEDAKCPAKDKIGIEDVIAGANGKMFKTSHDFGRRLTGGRGGWDGPMLELAGHIEDSQGKDGVLSLIVWPKGNKSEKKDVKIQLKPVGRFSPTFPYNCPRSEKMLEELCDFIVADYYSRNWKKPNVFYGAAHGEAHQILALMASGIPKYEPLIKKTISRYHGNRYSQNAGGFKMWEWGFDGIVMGEAYRLYKDKNLLPAMKSLAEVMALGSFNRNGIYSHRSYINIKQHGGKPYASMAAISGLDMIAMSIFKSQGLPYDKELYETIHQLYLKSTSPSSVNIAYSFGNSNPDGKSNGRDDRHAVIRLKDPSKGKSGKGPGYVCPTGMKDIGAYELVWPTKSDPRWKPTDWIEKEASENILEENASGSCTVYRNTGGGFRLPEPTKPYSTTGGGGHLAPVGMGALAHLIGNTDNKSWTYLGLHAANTCVRGKRTFDGHASSNLHAFWGILGAARSDNPEELRTYLDYMKTFVILSECHNGGLYLQPWGRDRPGCNSDVSFGPRILPTATGAILLSLPKKRLLITGAECGDTPASTSTSRIKTKTLGNSRLSR